MMISRGTVEAGEDACLNSSLLSDFVGGIAFISGNCDILQMIGGKKVC